MLLSDKFGIDIFFIMDFDKNFIFFIFFIILEKKSNVKFFKNSLFNLFFLSKIIQNNSF